MPVMLIPVLQAVAVTVAVRIVDVVLDDILK